MSHIDSSSVLFDPVMFKRTVCRDLENAVGSLKNVVSDYDHLVKDLADSWDTDGGRKQVKDLRKTRENEFTLLLSKVDEDFARVQEVAKNLQGMLKAGER